MPPLIRPTGLPRPSPCSLLSGRSAKEPVKGGACPQAAPCERAENSAGRYRPTGRSQPHRLRSSRRGRRCPGSAATVIMPANWPLPLLSAPIGGYRCLQDRQQEYFNVFASASLRMSGSGVRGVRELRDFAYRVALSGTPVCRSQPWAYYGGSEPSGLSSGRPTGAASEREPRGCF